VASVIDEFVSAAEPVVAPVVVYNGPHEQTRT